MVHKRTAVLISILIILSVAPLFAGSPNHHVSSPASEKVVASGAEGNSSSSTVIQFNHNANVTSPFSHSLGDLGSGRSNGSAISRYLYVPSKLSDITYSNGHVQPLYVNSPAPMGIGDLGLRNVSGQLQGYHYTTSSFNGTISVNSSSAFYLENDAPHSFAVQLNSVLTNVTVAGNTHNTYWTQNVAFYSTRTHTLQFVSNIWNFTSANASLPNSTIAYSNGSQYYYPGVYIALGPQYNVTFPFTLSLYLNTSVVDGLDAVYFNYTIHFANGTSKSGQYDMVEFNAGPGYGNGNPATAAVYAVNGNSTAPNGLLQDSEFIIGGPGGGSTSQFYSMNATMSLSYLKNGHYSNVPSAYDFGTDTGETATGLAESYSSGGKVTLSGGPSVLFGMWNTTETGNISTYQSGSVHYSGTISPANGFLFVSPGNTFSYSAAAWSPLNLSGGYSFYLPPGSFTALEMMALHTPQTFALSSGSHPMAYNSAMGIYTPLVAMDNQQLANISSSGTGTASDPYVIYNDSFGVGMNSLFAMINDFTFPEFSGILLHNISDHVILANTSSYSVNYPTQYSDLLYILGLPSSNNLNIEIYNSTNISVQNNVHITGWFSTILQGFPLANLVIWNSTGIDVSGNLFDSLGSSVLIYNNNATFSNNTVKSNTFAIEDTANYVFSASFLYGFNDYGLQLYSSNNTIYNNYFATILPIYSPSSDIYTGSPNVTYENSFTRHESGTNILGGSGISGNYWMNYVGFSTYNDYGLVSGTGESSPLQYGQGAIIQSSGIYTTTPWEVIVYTVVSINGTPSILAGLEAVEGGPAHYSLQNGNYDFVAAAEGQYFETQGSFTVSGSYQTVYNEFLSNTTYNITFKASGLPAGRSWYISLGGVGAYTSSQYVEYVGVPNGTYNFTSYAAGFSISPQNGQINVLGSPELVSLQLTRLNYSISFSETGLPAGKNWGVSINGTSYNSTGDYLNISLPSGNYTYSVMYVNGYIHTPGGKFSVNESNATIFVAYVPAQQQSPYLLALFAVAGIAAGATAVAIIMNIRKKP